MLKIIKSTSTHEIIVFERAKIDRCIEEIRNKTYTKAIQFSLVSDRFGWFRVFRGYLVLYWKCSERMYLFMERTDCVVLSIFKLVVRRVFASSSFGVRLLCVLVTELISRKLATKCARKAI